MFAIDNVPTVIGAGLTLDVAKYWDADEDAKLVYDNIANTAVYDGKRYAIPSFQFLKGIYINLSLFDKKICKLKLANGEWMMMVIQLKTGPMLNLLN